MEGDNEIRCKGCGKTWDTETTGFIEAFEVMIDTDFAKCPSCEDYDEDKPFYRAI